MVRKSEDEEGVGSAVLGAMRMEWCGGRRRWTWQLAKLEAQSCEDQEALNWRRVRVLGWASSLLHRGPRGTEGIREAFRFTAHHFHHRKPRTAHPGQSGRVTQGHGHRQREQTCTHRCTLVRWPRFRRTLRRE